MAKPTTVFVSPPAELLLRPRGGLLRHDGRLRGGLYHWGHDEPGGGRGLDGSEGSGCWWFIYRSIDLLPENFE